MYDLQEIKNFNNLLMRFWDCFLRESIGISGSKDGVRILIAISTRVWEGALNALVGCMWPKGHNTNINILVHAHWLTPVYIYIYIYIMVAYKQKRIYFTFSPQIFIFQSNLFRFPCTWISGKYSLHRLKFSLKFSDKNDYMLALIDKLLHTEIDRSIDR